jgi:hypothetical protein
MKTQAQAIDSNPISREQLKRLQTLYSQFAAASTDPRTRSREERLLCVSLIVGRQVESFSELTAAEAKTAIDRLKKNSSQRPVAGGQKKKKRMDAERAQRHGTDGRYDSGFRDAPRMAEAYDLEQIEGYYHRLGWSRDTFDAWLRSPRSPLGRRGRPQIRTIAEANRVRWALKRMLQKNGLWVASGQLPVTSGQ